MKFIFFQIYDEGRASMQEFHFVEQNGWPVSAKQENSLSVLDVCNGSHVTISTERVLLTQTRVSPETDNLPFNASTANKYQLVSLIFTLFSDTA